MSQLAFLTSSGLVLLGFILGIAVYPRFLGWARRYLDEFRGGTCAYCGLETYVTPCRRCGKEVAFCHYYAVLGTDVPNRESPRKRRSSQICTACLTIEERKALEALLK
jgi:hypothetical protein